MSMQAFDGSYGCRCINGRSGFARTNSYTHHIAYTSRNEVERNNEKTTMVFGNAPLNTVISLGATTKKTTATHIHSLTHVSVRKIYTLV